MQVKCPNCGGAGGVANLRTGSGERCVVCDGAGSVSVNGNDRPYWLIFTNSDWSQLVLAANEQGHTAITKPDGEADILIDRILASATGTYSAFIRDPNGKALMPRQTIPIYGELLAGTAQLPFRLPMKYQLSRTLGFEALFNDRSGVANTIQFVFAGRKLSS